MKTFVLFVGMALFATVVTSASGDPNGADHASVLQSTVDVFDAAGRAFASFESVAYAIDTTVHSGGIFVQAISGFARCATFVLALIGLSALGSARRLARRL